MAINIPIITEFSDKGLKSAEAGFKNFKSKVAEAEGGMGKLKAGFGAATDFMKANAATFAASAGAALAGFAIKAVGQFQNLALEVGKFSDATGLATEDASRWIEVAGDIGIEAGSLQASLNKLNKEIGKNEEKFKDLGIEIAKTDDGATDVNGTFLNVIDRLKGIKDPAERAALATQLLGRSWTDMSELVQMGSEDLRIALDSVGEGKIIDADEVRKARDFRAAQDELKDAIDELALSIGESLIPVLTRMAGNAKGAFDVVDKGVDAFSWWEKIQPWNFWENLSNSSDDATDSVKVFYDFLSTNIGTLTDTALAMLDVTREVDQLDQDVNGLVDTWDIMIGRFNDDAAWNKLEQDFADMKKQGEEAFGGNKDSADKFIQTLAGLSEDLGNYIAQIGTIPLEVQSDLQLLWERGEFETVMNYLDNYREGVIIPVWAARRTAITPSGQGSGRNRSTNSAPRASSGSTTSTSTAPPPEAPAGPPDLQVFGTPIGSNGAGGGRGRYPTVVVNVQGSVTSERDLVESIRQGLINSQRSGNQLVYSNT